MVIKKSSNTVKIYNLHFFISSPIAPGQNLTYEFTLQQHGSYWLHSHYMVNSVNSKKKKTLLNHVYRVNTWMVSVLLLSFITQTKPINTMKMSQSLSKVRQTRKNKVFLFTKSGYFFFDRLVSRTKYHKSWYFLEWKQSYWCRACAS